jgi:excisionase family DNA binding protein
MAAGEELITTGDAARLLGCSRQHVVDLCTRGALGYVSAGSHRRVRRREVEALVSRQLTRDQERSLWLHRAVAGRLALDPEPTLARARGNLNRWRQVHPAGMTAWWLDQWQDVLDEGIDVVFEVLTSAAPRAVELRQNSPFAGVLPAAERRAALNAFRDHWQHEHAA